MHKEKQKIGIIAIILTTMITPSTITTAAPFAQSTPRVSRNEYMAQFPNPIQVQAQIKADDLKYLPEINPTITFHYKTDAQDASSIWTTPWDIIGALGAFVTIFYCDANDPYVVAAQGIMSLAAPTLPRLFNYMTQTNAPELTNKNQG